MQRTNIYLEPRQTEALDRMARAEGTSRAVVIRRILDRALVGSDDLERDLAVIDASSGVLADADFLLPERADDDRSHHLERMWNESA